MRTVKKHLKWFLDRIIRDRLDSISAHVAFFLIISFLPFLALVLTLMQRINFQDGVPVLEATLNLFPPRAAEFIQGLFPSPLKTTGLLPVAIIAALWTSSAAMVALMKGLDHIYDVKNRRNFFHQRFVAILYVLGFAVVVLLTAAALVFGSAIYDFLLKHVPNFFITVLMNFKSLLGFLLLFLYFTLMFTFLPRRRIKLLHNVAGAAFSAAGWVLFSYFFSLFVENFGNYSVYGGLAALVILMTWLFFCMFILSLGAEVSVWLEFSGIQEDVKSAVKRRRKKRERARMEQQKKNAAKAADRQEDL